MKTNPIDTLKSVFASGMRDDTLTAFDAFARKNPAPTDWLFAYRVDFKTSDGSRGTLGIDCRDHKVAAKLLDEHLGKNATVLNIRYTDPDHDGVATWLVPRGQFSMHPAAKPQMNRAGSTDSELSLDRATQNPFAALEQREGRPHYFFAYLVRYGARDGSRALLAIDSRDPVEAYAKLLARAGSDVRVLDVQYIDPDHNAIASNLWV